MTITWQESRAGSRMSLTLYFIHGETFIIPMSVRFLMAQERYVGSLNRYHHHGWFFPRLPGQEHIRDASSSTPTSSYPTPREPPTLRGSLHQGDFYTRKGHLASHSPNATNQQRNTTRLTDDNITAQKGEFYKNIWEQVLAIEGTSQNTLP